VSFSVEAYTLSGRNRKPYKETAVNKFHYLAIAAVVLGVAAVMTIRVSADDKKMTIKEVMEKAHKGKESPVQTVIAGKADEKMLKEFLGYYKAMGDEKPPKGTEADWKKRTAALVDATQALIDKKPNAQAAFKTAVDCKACHTAHKPAKKQ